MRQPLARSIYVSGNLKATGWATFNLRRSIAMVNFLFWQKWLLVVGVAITAFGLLMAVSSGTSLFDLFNRQINPAFWSVNAIDDATRRFQEWIYGAWGATIAGWGIVLTYIARYPFSKKERWAWDSLILGVLVWFVLDTSLSLFHKVYFNVALNTVLLLLGMLPLVFTRRWFIQRQE